MRPSSLVVFSFVCSLVFTLRLFRDNQILPNFFFPRKGEFQKIFPLPGEPPCGDTPHLMGTPYPFTLLYGRLGSAANFFPYILPLILSFVITPSNDRLAKDIKSIHSKFRYALIIYAPKTKTLLAWNVAAVIKY